MLRSLHDDDDDEKNTQKITVYIMNYSEYTSILSVITIFFSEPCPCLMQKSKIFEAPLHVPIISIMIVILKAKLLEFHYTCFLLSSLLLFCSSFIIIIISTTFPRIKSAPRCMFSVHLLLFWAVKSVNFYFNVDLFVSNLTLAWNLTIF